MSFCCTSLSPNTAYLACPQPNTRPLAPRGSLAKGQSCPRAHSASRSSGHQRRLTHDPSSVAPWVSWALAFARGGGRGGRGWLGSTSRQGFLYSSAAPMCAKSPWGADCRKGRLRCSCFHFLPTSKLPLGSLLGLAPLPQSQASLAGGFLRTRGCTSCPHAGGTAQASSPSQPPAPTQEGCCVISWTLNKRKRGSQATLTQHIHTRTHTLTYIRTHAHTHTHNTHIHTQSHTPICTHPHTYPNICTYIYTHACTYTHTHIQTHVHICTRAHICSHVCLHTHTCTHRGETLVFPKHCAVVTRTRSEGRLD